MTTLKLIGFFRDLPHGDANEGSIASSVGLLSAETADAAARYLDAGTTFVAAPGIVRDVVDGALIGGGPNILTDGVFAWPSDLSHYLRKYRVTLPPVFLEHLLSRGSQPPRPEAINVHDLRLR